MCCCLSSEFTLRASAIISAPTHPCICLLLESDCQNGRHWLRLHALNTPLLTGLMSIFRLLKMRNMSVYMREQTGLLRLHGHLKSIGIFRSYGRFRGKGWYIYSHYHNSLIGFQWGKNAQLLQNRDQRENVPAFLIMPC